MLQSFIFFVQIRYKFTWAVGYNSVYPMLNTSLILLNLIKRPIHDMNPSSFEMEKEGFCNEVKKSHQINTKTSLSTYLTYKLF